jgi:hypothetical protein
MTTQHTTHGTPDPAQTHPVLRTWTLTEKHTHTQSCTRVGALSVSNCPFIVLALMGQASFEKGYEPPGGSHSSNTQNSDTRTHKHVRMQKHTSHKSTCPHFLAGRSQAKCFCIAGCTSWGQAYCNKKKPFNLHSLWESLV